MSFSTDTKTELAHLPLRSRIEAMLELSALARLAGTLVLRQGEAHLRFLSEHPDVVGRAVMLARFLYGETMEVRAQQNDRLQQRPMYFCELPSASMDALMQASGMDPLGGIAPPERERILGRLSIEKNARAYLRGAFLAAGSIVDPAKSYHLEIVTKGEPDSALFETIFHVLQLAVKMTRRSESDVFYVKDSEVMSDLLVAMGASQAMLELENVKAGKEVRNEINRKSNAEIANLDKQYRAALEQIEAIRRIEHHMGLSGLPESLVSLAQARLEHPMANYRELGETMEPPLGRSGVVHRMRRLMEIAKGINES